MANKYKNASRKLLTVGPDAPFQFTEAYKSLRTNPGKHKLAIKLISHILVNCLIYFNSRYFHIRHADKNRSI